MAEGYVCLNLHLNSFPLAPKEMKKEKESLYSRLLDATIALIHPVWDRKVARSEIIYKKLISRPYLFLQSAGKHQGLNYECFIVDMY